MGLSDIEYSFGYRDFGWGDFNCVLDPCKCVGGRTPCDKELMNLGILVAFSPYRTPLPLVAISHSLMIPNFKKLTEL